jgi:stearoyl-CoA desaturase (Delta-9 desaturase)
MNEQSLENQPKKTAINWVNASFLTLTPVLVFIALPSYLYKYGSDWRLWALFAFYYVASGVSITAGYHRLFSHKSYDANFLVRLLYLIFGATALEGSALKWCADHRRHHKFVDTDQDPYNISNGFFFAHMGWVYLQEDPRYAERPADLAKNPLIEWQRKYYVFIAFFFGFIVPGLIGAAFGSPWGGVLFGGFLRVLFTHHCTFFINSLCHMWGSQPYGDKTTARDNFILAFLTYGEGFHNFHHRFEADYRNGVRWYHWDPTKWVISALSLVSFTRNLRRISDVEILKARLSADEHRIMRWGFYDDKVKSLKSTIEESQRKMHQMKLRYKEMRQDLTAQNDERIRHMKLEIQQARNEFDAALAQWRLMCRAYREQFSIQALG